MIQIIRTIVTIVIVAFVLSFGLSYISQSTIPKLSLVFGIIITLLFIFIGVLFDIIGVSVTSADEAVFHSMSSRKVKGASLAVKFKKNADKVSSFCCDVIGDICGIISGAAGTTITAILYWGDNQQQALKDWKQALSGAIYVQDRLLQC